jgi:hypothetical protein
MKCTTCRKEYSPQCDYRQGRCALHPPVIQLKKSKDNQHERTLDRKV